MNNVKQRYFTFFLMSAFILAPSITMAQSVTTTSTDGSNEATSTTRDYIRWWRRGGSDVQQKVDALGSTAVYAVPIPVLFGVARGNIYASFGDPRSNGRTHIGNDILAPRGTPIVSPTKAVVLRTGVGPGEGNYVYTANPGGETFVYMHLDTFGEGVTSGAVLEKGSIIGYVGNTGNASGGAPHLHFEIHDSNGTAIDPYLRLIEEFTLSEKISYLNQIMAISANSSSLANTLVTQFRSTFNQALALNLTLPKVITDAMGTLPATTPVTTSSPVSLPAGDLQLGSKGYEVVKLQEFLIAKNIGTEAARLVYAGATGNFGAITQSALIEYQLSVGIAPATGYYGAATRVKVDSSAPPTTTAPVTVPSSPAVTTALTRNLYLGISGEDVRVLQKMLNAKGYTIASSGSGSTGNETTYFGPATLAAVVRYQNAKGITPAVGYVGSITRASLSTN